MSYNDLKDLEENNKSTLLSMFSGILNNIKNISFRKSSSIIKDFPNVCELSYKSYEYIENELNMSIVTSKRRMTVERATEIDEKYLELNDYNCLAVISSQTYNADGIMFEYTQSRHRPDYFCFQDTATRKH